MPAVLHLAAKDLRLLVRDRMGLFFVLVFPVIFGVFVGLIFGSLGFANTTLTVGVVDLDRSAVSERFIELLDEREGIEVRRIGDEEATRLILRRKIVGSVRLPQGFGDVAGVFWEAPPTVQIEVDPSRIAEKGMLHGRVVETMADLLMERLSDPDDLHALIEEAGRALEQGAFSRMQQALFLNQLRSIEGLLRLAQQTGYDVRSRLEPVIIESRPPGASAGVAHEGLVPRVRSPFEVSFPAAMMWGALGCAAGFATIIVRERTEGTYLRLQVAPITRVHIVAGKALACFTGIFAVTVLMIALGSVLGVRLANPIGLLVAVTACACCFVGFMAVMSQVGRTERAVDSGAWAVIIVLCMLGGAMIPVSFMPQWMQVASNFSPVKWGILALEGAMWRDFTLAEIARPSLLLAATGFVLFVLGTLLLVRSDRRAPA